MRNLTIKRAKSFVACMAKMKVYIEDATASEIAINKVHCRKLGELKNGEEKTFQISEENAKVFVIVDKLSRNYCNEFYEIPAGSEDIYLSGRNKYNPMNGNAFRFDGVTNEETLQNRKKGTQKGMIVLVVAVVIGVLAGGLIGGGIIARGIISNLFSEKESDPKTFSIDGMSITLTDEFIEVNDTGYTACYATEDIVVFALKEEFTLLEGFEDYTLEQYGNLVIENNGLNSSKLKSTNGLTYFEYEATNSETNDSYQYFAVVYKAEDAFWLIQFAALEGDTYKEYSQTFVDWAKSIEFLNK